MGLSKDKLLEIYPEYKKIYGPYTRKDGRSFIILYDGTRRSAMQYSRALMTVKVGRKLESDETVDHIDRNFNNDSIDNLQILSREKHCSLDSKKRSTIFKSCAWCNLKFELTLNQINRSEHNKNKAGPFCSKKCSGLYGKSVQLGRKKFGSLVSSKVSYYYLDK